MTSVVDLNVKINKWKMRLSELEQEMNQLKGKITFAEDIIKEENSELTSEVTISPSPSATAAVSLSAGIRELFKLHPDIELKNEDIFQYLKDKGIAFGKPSVYSILSKLVKAEIVEAIGKKGKERKYKLRKRESEQGKEEMEVQLLNLKK
jgi:hypothetical protein